MNKSCRSSVEVDANTKLYAQKMKERRFEIFAETRL